MGYWKLVGQRQEKVDVNVTGMNMLTEHQARVVGVLAAGGWLETRRRRRGFGILWDHRVTVLVDADGVEVLTVSPVTLARLREAGYGVEVVG